jgi:hypothetical protein
VEQVKERAVQKANWPGGGGPKVRTLLTLLGSM